MSDALLSDEDFIKVAETPLRTTMRRLSISSIDEPGNMVNVSE